MQRKIIILLAIISLLSLRTAARGESIERRGREAGALRYEDDPCAFDKNKGERYVFTEQAIMRSEPDPASEIITRLSQGTKFNGESATEIETVNGDVADRWYEATAGEKRGYVRGGDIADSAFTVPVAEYKLLFLIRNRTNGTISVTNPNLK